MLMEYAQSLSHVWLFATLWTAAHQAPLSMVFSRQEYSSGLPFPPPGDLPNPGIEPESPTSPALADGFFIHWATWEALLMKQKKEKDYKTYHKAIKHASTIYRHHTVPEAYRRCLINIFLNEWTDECNGSKASEEEAGCSHYGVNTNVLTSTWDAVQHPFKGQHRTWEFLSHFDYEESQ